MSIAQVMQIIQAAMITVLKVSAPILLASMAIGLIIAVLQAATQIHEQTVVFVPKLVASAIVLIVMGSWMLTNMKDFMNYIFEQIIKMT